MDCLLLKRLNELDKEMFLIRVDYWVENLWVTYP